MNSEKIIFFLSTGRTGTQFFTELIDAHFGSSVVKHAPSPELIAEGKMAYELYKKYGMDDERLNASFSVLIKLAREKMVKDSIDKYRIYIETNNRISFFAPALKTFFPNARFVFLYRHPGEFVRSGIRRDWYCGTLRHDKGRIVPIGSDSYHDKWNSFSLLQKISWLWMETNRFILDFKALHPDSVCEFYFNALSEKNCSELLKWIGVEPNHKIIKDFMPKKINAQTYGECPIYEEWEYENKKAMIEIVEEVASRLNIPL